jgi:hypothetical protein
VCRVIVVEQHVYLINDYGNNAPSDSPAVFCKSHLLARFDLGASR